ncbi:MAG: YicC family protein [Acidobacteriota bacterium]|nr:YicC family protein [Acidobacteriota bacterium]
MSSVPKAAGPRVRSMTGYATVRWQTSAGELTLSLRSVNHRGLDLHFHHASELAPFENAMRAVLKQNIGRGHIEIRGWLSREERSGSAAFNREQVGRYIAAFRQAAAEHGLTGQPDLNVALSMNGSLNGSAEVIVLDSSFEPEVVNAITACARELNHHREREAAELLGEFEREIAGVEESTTEILRIRKAAVEQFQQRLRERIKDLLGDSSLSEGRLLEEAAMLADRSDVQEELTRLSVHAQELRRILREGGEVGKRIDFLLQEMNRETNTILSKTSGIGETGLTITNRGLAIKAHIEKIREQALNLE